MNPVTHEHVAMTPAPNNSLTEVPSQSEILRKLRKKNLLTKGGK